MEEGRPAEGATGRDVSSEQEGRTGHTHWWRYSVERTEHFVWLRSSHPQLSTGDSVMRNQLEPCGIRI